MSGMCIPPGTVGLSIIHLPTKNHFHFSIRTLSWNCLLRFLGARLIVLAPGLTSGLLLFFYKIYYVIPVYFLRPKSLPPPLKHCFGDVIRGDILPNILLQRSPLMLPSIADVGGMADIIRGS